jgi:hypothetical protein
MSTDLFDDMQARGLVHAASETLFSLLLCCSA